MQINTATVIKMSTQELMMLEEQLSQQLKSKSVRSNDEKHAFVKRQLWIVRDALTDASEIAASTY